MAMLQQLEKQLNCTQTDQWTCNLVIHAVMLACWSNNCCGIPAPLAVRGHQLAGLPMYLCAIQPLLQLLEAFGPA